MKTVKIGTPDHCFYEIADGRVKVVEMTETAFNALDDDDMDYGTCVAFVDNALSIERDGSIVHDVTELELLGSLLQTKNEDNGD